MACRIRSERLPVESGPVCVHPGQVHRLHHLGEADRDSGKQTGRERALIVYQIIYLL